MQMTQEDAGELIGRMWMGAGPEERVNDAYRRTGISWALGDDLTY